MKPRKDFLDVWASTWGTLCIYCGCLHVSSVEATYPGLAGAVRVQCLDCHGVWHHGCQALTAQRRRLAHWLVLETGEWIPCMGSASAL